jgi:hypothetical protein
MAASRLSRSTRVWLVIAVGAVALLIAAGGSYVAVNAGGSPAAVTTETPETTLVPASPSPTLEPPLATGTPPAAVTATPPTEGTPTSSFPSPGISCPDGAPHYHVNIEKFQEELRQQAGLEDAVVTEVDLDTVRVEFQGMELTLTGWGESSTIGGTGDPSRELFERFVAAIDAVLFAC